MSDRFIVGCGAVIVNDSKMILMVRQSEGYWGGKWILPGGKLEIGETLEEAARREVLEETTCHYDTVRQIGAYVSYDPQTSFEKQVVLVYYLGKYRSGIATAGDGVTDSKWFDAEKIKSMAETGEVPAILIRVLNDAFGTF